MTLFQGQRVYSFMKPPINWEFNKPLFFKNKQKKCLGTFWTQFYGNPLDCRDVSDTTANEAHEISGGNVSRLRLIYPLGTTDACPGFSRKSCVNWAIWIKIMEMSKKTGLLTPIQLLKWNRKPSFLISSEPFNAQLQMDAFDHNSQYKYRFFCLFVFHGFWRLTQPTGYTW